MLFFNLKGIRSFNFSLLTFGAQIVLNMILNNILNDING